VASVPGRYLIIDTQADGGPALVSTDDVLPTALAERLDSIDAKLETIMSMAEAQQGQIQNLADGMNAVAAHVNAAQTMLSGWIAQHQDAALDFTPAMNALASIQTAAGTLDGLVPQAPSDPIQPVPAPPDPAPDPSTPVTDPSTPDLPPDTGIDPGTASDPTTTPSNGGTVTDTGGATDGIGVDPGSDSPPAPQQF
jgi:hypothetical protein